MPTVGRRAPNATHVQSVLFDRRHWDEARARAWLKSHDLYVDGLDTTTNFLRFRQVDPDATRFDYRQTAREGGPNGVSIVWGIPKGRVRKGGGLWDGVL